MEINKCAHKAKCDFYGCKNLAEYSFTTKGIIKRDLCFCGECLNGMYQAIAKMQTPKGTTSKFKLNKKLRREND
ncbi:MAG: hypothetical protein IJY90_00720 [Clostridia bacterium]|nr:hypothetical protein [Clostridia bacterium]